MIDVAQGLEDVLEELAAVQKKVNKLMTASVSGVPIRQRIKEIHRRWLPILGVLEKNSIVDASQVQSASQEWKRLMKLTDGKNPKSQYKRVLKLIITIIETHLLHSFI